MKALREGMERYLKYVVGKANCCFTWQTHHVSHQVYFDFRDLMVVYLFIYPQRVACLLRRVVQEIQHRIATQMEHIKSVR